MAYASKILADSVTKRGDRLTTFELTFPRIVLAEYNTHRMLARNSASSRAIPVVKQIRSLLDDAFTPEQFGLNQSGMQSTTMLSGPKSIEAMRIWLRGRNRAITTALELLFGEAHVAMFLNHLPRSFGTVDFDVTATREIILTKLTEFEEQLIKISRLEQSDPVAGADARTAFNAKFLNVHKQYANRVLETYMWQTVISTATHWSNFFALRDHVDAQPQIRKIARMMRVQYKENKPVLLTDSEWHLPLLQRDEVALAKANPEMWAAICSARCGRVSYLTHDGKRDPSADIRMYDKLVADGHMSPLEHVGRAMTDEEYAASATSGIFRGFVQFRKLAPNEHDYGLVLASRERTA